MNILFAWIGLTDLQISREKTDAGLGPIAQALKERNFDQIVLLSDHAPKVGRDFVKWLSEKRRIKILLKNTKLSSPTAFGEIYEKASEVIQDTLRGETKEHNLAFHLSPGTPAMAAVWIILSKTRFPAELIESSKEKGLSTASVPFDISADYIPDLLSKPDDDLVKLAEGLEIEAPQFDSIIYRCRAMKRVILMARRVASRNVPVLILGESGTGKELFARAIHRSSPRNSNPFITVNCGAIPHDLVESELFGHKKGAFTGAVSSRAGYLEEASGGTLFLDEIGDLPLNAQVKLLRVLQEGKLNRLGSTQSVNVDLRIISATNKDLRSEVSKERFREDLFHRLAVAILNIPPLREREGDLGCIISHFLKIINQESKDQPGHQEKKLSISGKNALTKHPWPGNVRELYNTILRAVIWSKGSTIDENDIKDSLLPVLQDENSDTLNQSIGNGFDIQVVITKVIAHYLEKALNKSGGNKSKAANLLGLPNYQTFSNWIKKYGANK